MSSRPLKVAVVGSGIAGLAAARRLALRHEVTIFEANAYAGGHTNTLDVPWEGRRYAVDTGFIVFNDRTYPNFVELLRELAIQRQPSNMSFSLRCERTGLEYNGTSLNTLFAQRRNILRPSFLRMLADILRFNRKSRELLTGGDAGLTLEDYLQRQGFSRAFAERYLLPMGRAIWSAPADAMLQCPARFFVDFFDRHGFLSIDERPTWYVVSGGSRQYVRALLLHTPATLRLSTPVTAIRRQPHQVGIATQDGRMEYFDAVFLACHADRAVALLEAPTAAEREVLAAFPYTDNEAILHTDDSLLPRRPLARAAWNYHLLANPQQPVAVTYDMNILQSLSAPVRFLVSLNHTRAIDKRRIIERILYRHPVYLPAGVAAQQRHREIDGTQRTYYCGAYWRYGFHEDGVVSALTAVDHFEKDLDSEQRDLYRVG